MTETANERFERLAEAFQRETGMMAPGKDLPAEMGGAGNEAERWARWQTWLTARRAFPGGGEPAP